jgi:amino acid transporter
MKSSSPPADSPQVLRANALSFPSVLMQSITHIAPAVGLVFVLQFITTMAIGLGIGLWIGPDQEYYVIAVAMTLGLMFIYCAGNIGVFFYYRRERPAEFRFLLHFLLPLLSTVSLLWVAYKSAVPLPEPPVRYAPIAAAVWLFCGVVIMLTARRAGGAPLLPLDAVRTVHVGVAGSAVLGAPATGEPIG